MAASDPAMVSRIFSPAAAALDLAAAVLPPILRVVLLQQVGARAHDGCSSCPPLPDTTTHAGTFHRELSCGTT